MASAVGQEETYENFEQQQKKLSFLLLLLFTVKPKTVPSSLFLIVIMVAVDLRKSI
jgi:hypothetical protein